MSDKTVKFLFDYVSPYSYLAWTQLPRLVRTYGISIAPVPVLFAGLLEAHGHKGPAEIPAKRRWMIDNVLQIAASLNEPIRPPAYHPFNPLLPLRVTAMFDGEAEQSRVIAACFRGAWQQGAHLSEPAVLEALLSDAGVDGAAAVQRGLQAAAKERLRRATSDAVAEGVFGVPSFLLDEQLFWGVSDLPLIEAKLRGERTLDRAAAADWQTRVRPSATRKSL